MWIEPGPDVIKIRWQPTFVAHIGVAARREVASDRRLRAAQAVERMTRQAVQPIHRCRKLIVRHVVASAIRKRSQKRDHRFILRR